MSERGADEGADGGWDCHVHVFDAAAPVRAGHYQPAHRPLAPIEAEAARHGVHHLVLVQPSVYGDDHTVLLAALRAGAGRHRGVVVLRGDESAASLDAMHTLGVRGARLNLVSPVGELGPPAERFARLAPLLRARGWHLQWYVPSALLPLVAALHAHSGVVAVLDHLGGLHAQAADDPAAWHALRTLAAQGAWIKLSGWYRLGSARPPFADLAEPARRVVALFGERVVWGSDWPHTSLAADAAPAYADVLAPWHAALGAAAAALLRREPAVYR